MSKTPRRMQMLQWCKAEKMIQEAVDEVEGMGADIRLTAAVIALSEARGHVADFVDGAPFRSTSTRVSDSQGEEAEYVHLCLRENGEYTLRPYHSFLCSLCRVNRDTNLAGNKKTIEILKECFRALSTLREENERLRERMKEIEESRLRLATLIDMPNKLSRLENEHARAEASIIVQKEMFRSRAEKEGEG